jgi:hypothetical protein
MGFVMVHNRRRKMKKLFVLILLFFAIDIAAQEVQPEEVEEVTIAVEYKAPKNLIKGAAEQLGWTGYIEELEEFVVGFEADGVTEILENRLVKKEQTYIEFMEKYVQTQILRLVNRPYSEIAEKDMRAQLMAVKQKISEENAQRLKIVVSE